MKTKKGPLWQTPTLALLVKLGSALVHAEEYLSNNGHPFDLDEFKSLMADIEVKAWIESGISAALLPRPRTRRLP